MENQSGFALTIKVPKNHRRGSEAYFVTCIVSSERPVCEAEILMLDAVLFGQGATLMPQNDNVSEHLGTVLESSLTRN